MAPLRALLRRVPCLPALYHAGERTLHRWREDDRVYPDLRCAALTLGSDYGGWTIAPHRLHRDSVVYCVGVGRDISFDLALIERCGVTVHALDPTPRSIAWLKTQTLPRQFVFHPVGLADYDGVASFRPPAEDTHVSYAMSPHGDHHTVAAPVKRLATILRELGHDRLDLLKIDIEGAEYAVISDLLRTPIRPTQLLIEFHRCRGTAPLRETTAAVAALRRAGWKVFASSAIGINLSFLDQRSRRAATP